MGANSATAEVRSARVYTNGCVLTCGGMVEVDQGNNTILVDCLPQGAVEDSLRVRMPATVSLLSVGISHDEAPGLSDAMQHVTQCERAVAHLDARIANRSSQKELWLVPARAGSGSEVVLEDLEAYLEHLPSHLDALDDELAELRAKRDDAERELEEARDEVTALRAQAQRGLLRLCIVSQQAGKVPLEVDVRSSYASWRPVYDVLVDSFSEPLRLRLRAEVSQSTGLDWADTELVLSTAAPAAHGTLPHLLPVRLRKHVEAPSPHVRGMARAGAAPMARSSASLDETTILFDAEEVMDYSSPDATIEMSAPEATSNTLANSVEYNVAGTWSVASGAEATLVEVQAKTIDATYCWRAVPVLDDSVYMVAVLREPLDSEAVGQSASVYLEGEFCGQVVLDEPAADDSIEISLGVDTRMRSSHQLVQRKASSTLLRGRRSEETVLELEVTSNREEPVQVTLVDHVPLSEEKEIVVEAGERSGALFDEETGELRWEFTLGPRATERRRFSYVVSHPKDLVVETVSQTSRTWCPFCGAAVIGSTTFCPSCGGRL